MTRLSSSPALNARYSAATSTGTGSGATSGACRVVFVASHRAGRDRDSVSQHPNHRRRLAV
jgi:hypothetical protein